MSYPAPKVSVVILNWNGCHYLKQFLPSVLSSTYPNLEVVVADNGSADGSVVWLQKEYPDVKLILFNENMGFAKGYNEALKQIDTELVLLLNSDIEVEKSWIEPLVDKIMSDRLIAACQPKILSFKNKIIFEYAGGAGGWLDKYGYPFARGRIFDVCEEDTGQYDNEAQVFWTSGAAMLIKKKVFLEAGGFDNYFFAHQEEIDLCWRIQLAGYKLYNCPASVVYHVGGGTLPRGNSLKTYLNFRNNQIMLYKNLPFSQRIWKIPFRIWLDAISAWKGLLTGDSGYFIAIFRAHLAFLKWVFLYKKKSVFPGKRTGKLTGILNKNLVWQHFVKKKNQFSQIVANTG